MREIILALHLTNYLLNVLVQEIAIQQCLNDTRNKRNPNQIAINNVSVNPRKDVEESVRTEGEEVVRCQRVVAVCVFQEEDLGQDGDGLEVLAKCPQDRAHLVERLAVEQQRKDRAGNDEVAEAEGVVVLVVGCLPRVDVVHEVADVDGRGDEEELHECVVERDEVVEKVDVAGEEDDGVEELGAEGDAGGGFLAEHFGEKDDDRGKVQHICNKSEEVHHLLFFFFFFDKVQRLTFFI